MYLSYKLQYVNQYHLYEKIKLVVDFISFIRLRGLIDSIQNNCQSGIS